jgi:hypothetical protein
MRADTTQIRPVINLLGSIVKNNELDMDKISDGIDSLESLKNIIGIEDDETIDKIDEVQDYLHYLMSVEEVTVSDEIREEITDMIESLQNLYM